MKVWKVWSGICKRELPVLEIAADSFDEAIDGAREIDKAYDTAQLSGSILLPTNFKEDKLC